MKGLTRISRVVATILVNLTWVAASKAQEPGVTRSSDATMTDIIDIKPIHEIVLPFPIIWLVLAIVVLVILAVLLFLFLKNRRKTHQQSVPNLPPHEIAAKELEELANEKSITPREFHFKLSAILRGYIEGRFAVPALEMTTEEFLPCLDKLAIDRELTTGISSMTKRADPIKFAGLDANRTSLDNDLGLVIRFVEQTRPDESVPDEAGGENV